MTRPVLALALALALAGCLNGDPIPPTPSPPLTAQAPEASAGPAPAPANATQARAGPNQTAPADATPPANATAPVAVPIAWNGTLAAQLCRPDPVGATCSSVLPGEPATHAVEVGAGLATGWVELAWEAAPGGPERLTLVVAQGEQVLDQGTGPSPLRLEFWLASTQPLTLSVSAAASTPDPVVGYAHGEQAFAVVGLLSGP